MKLTVQVVMHADDETETVVREAFMETDQNRGCDMRSHVVSDSVEEVD